MRESVEVFGPLVITYVACQFRRREERDSKIRFGWFDLLLVRFRSLSYPLRLAIYGAAILLEGVLVWLIWPPESDIDRSGLLYCSAMIAFLTVVFIDEFHRWRHRDVDLTWQRWGSSTQTFMWLLLIASFIIMMVKRSCF